MDDHLQHSLLSSAFQPGVSRLDKDQGSLRKWTRIQEGFKVRSQEEANPLYSATMGLKGFYERVRSTQNRRPRSGSLVDLLQLPRTLPESSITNITLEDGALRVGPHLPVFMNRYRYTGLMGQGTFAQIICAEDTWSPTKHQVAIKILNLHYREIGKREALCLRLLHQSPEAGHASIIRIHSAFDFMGHFCLAMELCSEGSLQAYVHPAPAVAPAPFLAGPVCSMPSIQPARLSLPQVREVALQLVKALVLLSHHDLIHADIKPENVLLTSDNNRGDGSSTNSSINVRLTDFGNAIKSSEVSLYEEDFQIQTMAYRAPEVLLGGSGGRSFDAKIDMWSLGVVLVEVFLGRSLFRAPSQLLMVQRIVSVLGPLPARKFVTGKYYRAYFGDDHRLRAEVLERIDENCYTTPMLIDPTEIQNSFSYDSSLHHRNIMELLNSRDSHFISFIAGLLDLDPETRLSPMEALLHPFFQPIFPFSLLLPYMLPSPTKNTKRPLRVMTMPRNMCANNRRLKSNSVHDMLGVTNRRHGGNKGVGYKRVEEEDEGEHDRSHDETVMEEDDEEEEEDEQELVRWAQKRAKLSPHLDDPAALDTDVEVGFQFEPSPVGFETSE